MPDIICRVCGEWSGDGRGGDGPPSYCICERRALARGETLDRSFYGGPRDPIPAPSPPPEPVWSFGTEPETNHTIQVEMDDEPCPACGGVQVRMQAVAQTVNVPLGPAKHYTATRAECLACEESWEPHGVNDGRVEAAYLASGIDLIRTAIDQLGQQSVQPVTIDRILGLKIGTAAQWREGVNVSREAVALMRILMVFPWLLDVADEDYAEESTARIVRSFLLLD